MRREFKIGQSNEVIKAGRTYDLHNDYVSTAIIFDARSNSLKVIFKKVAEDDAGRHVALVFHEVDILEFSGNFGAGGASGLDEIGYKDVSDYDYEWLSGEAQSTTTDHLIIRFDSNATLRLHSARADFVEDRTLTSLEGREV
jgi:hypothetical protein